MVAKTVSELKKAIQDKKLELFELEDEYRTAVYLSKMPEYNPTYAYSYDRCNFSITPSEQSVVNWLKAVARHMSNRRPAHGGEYNNVYIVSILEGGTEPQIARWADHQREKIFKAAMKHKKRALK